MNETNQNKIKKPGILGGLGPQATEIFYHEFIRLCQIREKVVYPNMLINSMNLFNFLNLINNKEALVELVKEEINKIHNYVDFIASPCNTIHFIIDEMREYSKVPIIAIHEEVVKEVCKPQIRKIGILGTKTTVYNNFYQDELRDYNIVSEILDEKNEDKLHSLIFNKILLGKNHDEILHHLLSFIGLLKNKGCQGIILACTELPGFIKQKNTDVQIFSSTEILAKSVFENVFGTYQEF